MPSRASSPALSATSARRPRSPSAWPSRGIPSIRTTRARRTIGAGARPRCCSPDITSGSRPGGASEAANVARPSGQATGAENGAARGDVRRAKLYYLRDRVGKRARVRERRYTGPEAAVEPGLLHEPTGATDAEGLTAEEAVAEANPDLQADEAAVEGATDRRSASEPAR